MKVTVSLFNSKTKDVAIVIDLLRASTTITIALNTFNKVIPVNTSNEAFELKNKYNALLAGEDNLKTLNLVFKGYESARIHQVIELN